VCTRARLMTFGPHWNRLALLVHEILFCFEDVNLALSSSHDIPAYPTMCWGGFEVSRAASWAICETFRLNKANPRINNVELWVTSFIVFHEHVRRYVPGTTRYRRMQGSIPELIDLRLRQEDHRKPHRVAYSVTLHRPFALYTVL
jgi:hypothetical protein